VAPPGLTEEERAAALSGPPPRVPRNAIVWTVLGCLLLGLGGVVGDHFFGAGSKAGLTPVPTVGTNPPPLPTLPPPGVDPNLGSSTVSMMRLRGASGDLAPVISLTGPSGKPFLLTSLRGRVVVLWFFNAACDDICPIAEREIAEAMRDLGRADREVVFVAVNTDPFALSVAQAAPALRAMAHPVGTFEFLTGSLAALDRVWKAYGVTVQSQPASRVATHNEVLYFVGENGRVEAQATPFADQTGNLTLVLPAATEESFAKGIADETAFLVSKGAS
jgi:protein SCO1/2